LDEQPVDGGKPGNNAYDFGDGLPVFSIGARWGSEDLAVNDLCEALALQCRAKLQEYAKQLKPAHCLYSIDKTPHTAVFGWKFPIPIKGDVLK